MPETIIHNGDITQMSADVLVTAINSGGLWFGGVDRAIMRAAGDTFHAQAAARTPLHDGDVIFAAGDGSLLFHDVIFVVDDLQRPLREIVLAGLNEAETRSCRTVSLPTLRTDVMAGAYEPTIEAALDETNAAIRQFWASQPSHVWRIIVSVYDDAESVAYLITKLPGSY